MLQAAEAETLQAWPPKLYRVIFVATGHRPAQIQGEEKWASFRRGSLTVPPRVGEVAEAAFGSRSATEFCVLSPLLIPPAVLLSVFPEPYLLPLRRTPFPSIRYPHTSNDRWFVKRKKVPPVEGLGAVRKLPYCGVILQLGRPWSGLNSVLWPSFPPC